MNRKEGDLFWCLECQSMVESHDHRCEQWSNVCHIPEEAVGAIKDTATRELVEQLHSAKDMVVEFHKHFEELHEEYLSVSRDLSASLKNEGILMDALDTILNQEMEMDNLRSDFHRGRYIQWAFALSVIKNAMERMTENMKEAEGES